MFVSRIIESSGGTKGVEHFITFAVAKGKIKNFLVGI
jgi:hypothetical protein